MATIQEQVILADKCRFHVGGPADFYVEIVPTPEAVGAALAFAKEHGQQYFVYSGGTNLFFDDAGFRGLVIRVSGGSWQVSANENKVTVSSGCDLWQVVRSLAEDHSLGGLDFLANIPGNVGGAVVGNAGCYGRGVADVLDSAVVYDTRIDQTAKVPVDFFQYAYRHSRLKYSDRYIVLTVTLRVEPVADKQAVLRGIAAELEERRQKHPHDAWCAGSYFKNPSREAAAWKLITDAGMAGASVGGACLNPLHANFLMNAGKAKSSEIIELTRMIQRAVRDKSGHLLTPEVRYVSPTGVEELLPEDA